MKKKEALFDLIRSLTQNEKRFFKIYASRHTIRGKNNYVKLFEAVDSLKKYDEVKLFQKVKNESFIKHFSAEKNYLYNLILECLDIYHKDSSVDRQINKFINIARVLSDKRLDEQSVNIVEKVKKLSDQYNRFENIIPLIILQKNTGFDRDTITEEELELYYREVFSALEKLRIKFEYNKIRDVLLLKRRMTGPMKNARDLEFLKTFYKKPFFRDNSKVNSFDANVYYLLGKIEYYRILRDFNKGSIYSKKLISLFETHENRIADCASLYIYALNCFIVECHYMDRKHEVTAVLEKILSLPSRIGEKNVTNDIRVKIFEVYYTGITDVCLHFREHQKGIGYVPAIEEGIKEYNVRITPTFKLVMLINVACLYFGAGDYKQALKWCNTILNNPPTSNREDIFCIARILNLLIHLELGNAVILPSIIKSTYRFLYKKKRVYQFETLFLKYIKLFSKSDMRKEQLQLYREFRKDLQPLLNDKFENIIFNDIDLSGWIDKKTGGKLPV